MLFWDCNRWNSEKYCFVSDWPVWVGYRWRENYLCKTMVGRCSSQALPLNAELEEFMDVTLWTLMFRISARFLLVDVQRYVNLRMSAKIPLPANIGHDKCIFFSWTQLRFFLLQVRYRPTALKKSLLPLLIEKRREGGKEDSGVGDGNDAWMGISSWWSQSSLN